MSEAPPTDPTQASGSVPPPEEGAGEGAAAPSKKGAKKAEAKAKKEAEKAKRAAERAAAEAQAKAAAGGGEDLAKDNYGNIQPSTKVDAERVNLKKLGEEHLGKTIKLRAWIQNSRMQGAKMAFVELREERNWAIQGVMSVSPEGKPVSKQMVKWVGSLNLESFVLVEATVQKPLDPVKSCRVSNYELHLTKCYLIATGPEVLGMTLNASNKAISSFDDEDPAEGAPTEGVKDLSLTEAAGAPSATLVTHLNNPVMHKVTQIRLNEKRSAC